MYRLMRIAMRLAVHLFFRRIDVEAPQNVPSLGPVLLAANHTNALVDPLIILTAIRRPVTVTAKQALANNILLRWLMAAFGVVTFQRQQDAGREKRHRENLKSLQRCQEILAQGGAICIFPEGISHSDSKLRAFRHGVARISLQFVHESGNPGRLWIVPVGLLYTAKDRFRSDVWLRFGDPLDVERWLAERPDSKVTDLTHEVEQRVAALTINTPSRREQWLLTWAAEIVATRGVAPVSLGSENSTVAEWFRLLGRLKNGWEWLYRSRPHMCQQLARRIRDFRRRLRRAGIVPSEVFLQLNYGRAAFFLLRELELMIIGGPIALLGAINHAAPYFTVKFLTTKLSRDKDHWASNAIYTSFAMFPLFYVLQLGAAWLLLPRLWAVIYTFALPYTGYYAILYGDRFQRAWRRAHTFVRFTLRPDMQRELADEGRGIVEEIRALAHVMETEQQAVATPTEGVAAFQLSATDVKQRLAEDMVTLRDVRDGLARLEARWSDSRRSIAARERGYFTPKEDDRVRQMVLAYRNYRLALYEIIHRYLECDELPNPSNERRAFMLAYAAALTLQAKSARLIRAYEHDRLVRQKLNEPDARFGLPAGFFDDIRSAYTSLVNRRQLAGCQAIWANYCRQLRSASSPCSADDQWLCKVIRSERRAMRRSLWSIVTERARWDWTSLWHTAYAPLYRARYGLRSFVGGTLGNVRLGHDQPALQAGMVVADLQKRLRPGDVILMRAERKITTALLPGFWCHAALYVGTREDLDSLGLRLLPAVAKHWSTMAECEEPNGCVIEAVNPGVIIRSLEQALQVDHVAILRPRIGTISLNQAIADAFSHVGKPYDFEFDFSISTRLVCTELVYRIYHGRGQIDFELTKRVGRFTLTCDDIANAFLAQARENPTNAPFDLVALTRRGDGGRAEFVRDEEAFGALANLATHRSSTID